MAKPSTILDTSGQPYMRQNGHARPELAAFYAPKRGERKAKLSYDSARTGTDLDNHWAFADSLDADSANNRQVRQTLTKRSRYEHGSNGYYAGIIRTHANMLVGTGPSLRMMTGNRAFNQLVEREWFKWSQQVQLRRKLWCMAHARTQDGEAFGVLQTNPALPDVQVDLLLIEAEQCQTPFVPVNDAGYIDGIKFDEFNNILWYDVLPVHPGSSLYGNFFEPIRVGPRDMLHWFKLERAGAHRGVPDLTSTLNVGATSRRHREATVAAAETAADIGAMLTTQFGPAGTNEAEPVAPFSSVEFAKRMMMVAPQGWDAKQMKGEHPNAQYAEFHRLNVSETARPLSMPYNAAACDSSTYSFASGKLDYLAYRTALDVERQDASELVLDPLFAAWFREWTIVADRRDIPPAHQWDWPKHQVIDAVAEENARDTKLKNGTLTMRQAFSDDGMDYEDQLAVKAEDLFGEASEENIRKCRQIDAIRNTPAPAMQYVAQILGIQVTPSVPAQQEAADAQSA